MNESQNVGQTPPVIPGEAESIAIVKLLGSAHGYGNLIAHLRDAWSQSLQEDFGFTSDQADHAAGHICSWCGVDTRKMTNKQETILGALNEIIRSRMSYEDQHCTAKELMHSVWFLLDDITLADDDEGETLSSWVDLLAEARCKVTGSHDWTFDQCGYWGHQFCIACHHPKYPELIKLRCGEAKKMTGDVTEEEYNERP